MSRISSEIQRQGIVVATRGNHGLAVAWAAQDRGVFCNVVVPENNNPDIVISLGLTASIKVIHVEKIAFNLKKLDKEPGMLFRFRRIET